MSLLQISIMQTAMAHSDTPKKGDAKYWESIINTGDYDTFFRDAQYNEENEDEAGLRGNVPMPKNYLHFVYAYTVCCGDRKKLDAWLSDKQLQADPNNHVFKKITPSDEAWAVANVVNQYDGWCDKFAKLDDMTDKIHKRSLGKWTSLKKKDKDETGIGRSFAKSGWHSDGVLFYNKAVQFFKTARQDERFKEMIRNARAMWLREIIKRMNRGTKRRRCEDDDIEEAVTEAPVMEWDVDGEQDEIRNYTVV